MQLARLIRDDEGVSPVIGVILMVAITVILAAVIAAFVLGIGDTEDPAPSSSLEYELNENPSGTPSVALEVSHESGDAFVGGDVQVNLEAVGGSSPGEISDGVTFDEVTTDLSSGSEQFAPGETIQITDTVVTGGGPLQASPANADQLVIELVWAPGGGDAQSVFSEDTLRNVDTSVVPGWSP